MNMCMKSTCSQNSEVSPALGQVCTLEEGIGKAMDGSTGLVPLRLSRLHLFKR